MNKNDNKPKSKVDMGQAIKGFVVIGCVIAAVIFYGFYLSGGDKQKAKPVKKITRYGQTKKDLGYQSETLGSRGQAKALLALIKDKPKKVDYQISYETDSDTIIFGCNFKKNVIIRIHQRENGHGTQEVFQGHILARLQNAANGGSLNDTPNGKSPGSMKSF